MLGFFSFTEVTDPAAHHAYNAWHQLDHLPEQFSLDGVLFGQRWVLSPPCKELRVAVSPQLDPCQYMTLYLLRDADVLPAFAALAERLRDQDRFFAERRAHLSGAFGVSGRWTSPRVPVSAEVVPFRAANGVFVIVDLGGSAAVDGAALSECDGVAGVWAFVDATAGRHITVAFVDGDLLATGRALGQMCLKIGAGAEWAGPLERIDLNEWDWFDRLTPQ